MEVARSVIDLQGLYSLAGGFQASEDSFVDKCFVEFIVLPVVYCYSRNLVNSICTVWKTY